MGWLALSLRGLCVKRILVRTALYAQSYMLEGTGRGTGLDVDHYCTAAHACTSHQMSTTPISRGKLPKNRNRTQSKGCPDDAEGRFTLCAIHVFSHTFRRDTAVPGTHLGRGTAHRGEVTALPSKIPCLSAVGAFIRGSGDSLCCTTYIKPRTYQY